ncbi:MAG: hypothetical protein SFX19_01605 [Alphaproteobacteria bacterium]|nr:hypothetical protein [Alphaproteobacteria bacterium]
MEGSLPTLKNHSLRIKRTVDDAFDKVGFFAAFAIGTIGISWMKYEHVAQAWVTAFPVCIMLLYAGIVLFNRRVQLREDQSGDNLYYLGFLFTLVSIAFALAQFNGKDGTQQIIENFGIALATTISGLVLRVCFNQMRHDPVETEREARMELANTAARLRTDLLEVTHTMKSTLTAVVQQTAEAMMDYGKHFDEAAKVIIEKTDHAHAEFIENSKKLNATTGKFVKSVEALLARIDEIQPPTSLLEDKLAPAVDSIRAAAEEIRNRAKGDERIVAQLGKLIENAIAASQHLEDKVKVISDQSDKTSDILARLNDIGGQFAKSGEQFQQAAQFVAQLSETQKSAQDKINTMLANTTEAAGGSLTSMHEKIAGVLTDINAASTRAIEAVTETINKSIGVQQNALTSLEQSAAEILANTKQHNSALADELAQSRELTRKVHDSLVSMTEALNEQVGGERQPYAAAV